MNWIPPRPIWFVTTTNVSFAAVVLPPRKICRDWCDRSGMSAAFNTHIGCAFETDLADTACVSCGQCIVACPTGALYEKR